MKAHRPIGNEGGLRRTLNVSSAFMALFFFLATVTAGHAASFTLEGQNKGNTTTWSAGNLQDWQELDYIPCRVHITAQVNNQTFVISFPHLTGTTPGIENLYSFTNSANVVMISPPVLSAPTNADWSYTFTVTVTNGSDASVGFMTRLAAGAHLNTGSSLMLGGSPSSMGSLQIHKPAAGPGQPDLAITKTGPATIPQGGLITYTLSYTNKTTTNTAVGVQVSDIVPPEVIVDTNSLPANARFAGNTIFWDLTNLVGRASGQVSFSGQVPMTTPVGRVINNFSQILSSENDANFADNTSTWQTTVTGGCQTPALTCVGNKTVQCGDAWTFDQPSTSDAAAAGSLAIVGTVTNALCGQTFSATRTWTATDACGNTAQCSQTVTVADTNAPTITCAGDKTVEFGTAWDFDAPTAGDSCGTNTIIVVSSVTNATCGNTFTATRTWQTTDACGNSATCAQTVTVSDTTAPIITCVGNKTVECGSAWTFDAPGATDVGGTNSISILSTVTNGLCGQTFSATRTWQATDACGNVAQCSQTVTVADTTAPTITCAGNKTVEAGAGWTFDAPSAIDGCGTNSVSVVNTITNVTCGNAFVATRTWRATDACGNPAECSQTVTVIDKTAPVLTCSTNLILNADPGQCGRSNVTFVVTATDNCDVSQLTSFPASGSTFPVGTTTVTSIAVDVNGNSNTCSFTVTILDSEQPTITCPGTVTANADSGSCFATDISLGSPTASDNCGVASVTNNAAAVFPVGTNIVTWTVTDIHGNSASCQQTVIVNDTQNPTIICPATVIATANVDSCFATGGTLGTPTVSDNCGVAFVTNNATASFPIGTNHVTWTVQDNSGNIATCIQTVIVNDTQLPTITCPALVTVNADNGSCSATGVVLGNPTVNDNCGVASVTNNAPDSFPIGTNFVTWTVTDNSGNSATCIQTVIVNDSQLPTISCPGLVTVNADNNSCSASGVTLGTPTVNDNCTILSITNNAPANFPIGTNYVTWTIKDNSGNSETCVQIVIVRDTQLPTINCPALVTVNADADSCIASGVILGAPVVSDNCGVTSITNDAPAVFPIGTNSVTWTIQDSSGNSATCIQTVVVKDIQLPTINCPTLVAVNADAGSCAATGVTLGTPTVNDNCSVISVTNDAPAAFPVGTNVVTWTVRDNSGNSATCLQTVIVTDAQVPTISCPALVTVNANDGQCAAANVVLGAPVVADNCGVASITNNAPSSFPVGTNIVTWSVTDTHGNTATCEQIVIVNDHQNPAITCPTTVIANADAGTCFASGLALDVPVTSDNCGVATVTSNAPATFPVGTNFVTWIVADIHGNSNTCQQMVIVNDNQLPTINCPATVTVNADSGNCSATGVALGAPTMSDNCGVATVTSNAPSVFPVGTNVVTWTVTDIHGNTATCEQMVIVNDNQNPTITCPIAIIANADAGVCFATGLVLNVPVTSDNCGVATVTSNAPAMFPVGTNIVTWIVTDIHGNSNSCQQTVIVNDNQLPTIDCPATVTVNADAGNCFASAVILGTPTTADNCGVASVTNNAPATFPVGTNFVIWTVTDIHGNTATCQQAVVVSDDQRPTITCPATVTVSADPGNCSATGVALSVPTTSDNCGVATVTSNAPSILPVGTNVVTWTVTDIHGNTATCEQLVIVNDNQNPTIACPATVIANADAGVCFATGLVLGAPVTSDNCGVAAVTSNAPAIFPVGTNVVTWNVTDIHGNSNTCQQTVIVNDNQLPTINCPATVTVNADSGNCFATGVALGAPTTSDNCGVATVTSNAPSIFPVGTNIVTWTVTDIHGNTATCEQAVIVNDNQNPTMTCPPTVTVNADLGVCFASGVSLGDPTTSDNCGVASVTNNAPTTFPVGTNIVIWTVTDVHGNTAACNQLVIVKDAQLPTINCPVDITVSANAGCTATGVALGTPVTSDNCSVAFVSSNAPTIYSLGTNIVTWTVVDGNGNTNTCTQRVIVRDTTLPTITCPNDVIVSANASCAATGVTLGAPVTGDNCGVASVTNNAPAVYSLGTNFVTWKVTDNSGNTNTCTQRVIVRDTTPPSITCPPNITVNASAGQCGSNVTFIVSAADNCGTIASIVNSPSSGFAFPVGTTTVTSTATDSSGNTNRCTFTVTVVDSQPPLITCPATVSVDTAPGATTITNVALGTPVVSDNCTVVSVTNNAPSVLPVGTNIITWTVTDSAGLTNKCQQQVIVIRSCSEVLNVSALTDQTVCAHDPALFQVSASSPDPIAFTWRFNGQVLAGRTNNSLLLSYPETTDGGVYSVEARTPCKAVTNSATLTVLPLPTSSVVTYSNSDGVVIPLYGAAGPYPSVIAPQCVPGVVKKVSVTLYSYTHTFPSDVNVMLVSPDGRKVMLMAGAGDDIAGSGVNLAFSDASGQPVPATGTIVSGDYKPSNYNPAVTFSSPAPGGPYSTDLSTFIGTQPNGQWKLFVYDDVSGDAGNIANWTLTIEWGFEETLPLLLTNPRMTNGTFTTDVWGKTGVPTVIQRSSNLVNWVSIATNVFNVSPSSFSDSQAGTFPRRFYRAWQP